MEDSRDGQAVQARKVLCAPNAFKETLSSLEAAAAMSEGVRRVLLSRGGLSHWTVREFPLADGGDSTVRVLASTLPTARLVPVAVEDARGRQVTAEILVMDSLVVIEAAQAIGISRLHDDERDPFRTSSFGVGQMLVAALELPEVRRVVVCLGGSATNDCGLGMAAAIGFEFTDEHGVVIPRPTGADLGRVAGVSPPPQPLRSVEISVACDVTAPLLGPTGASLAFSGQKGARSAEARLALEEGMSAMSHVVLAEALGRLEVAALEGAGAAGGLGAGLAAFAGAKLESGFAWVAKVTGLEAALGDADLVLTGEGRVDETTAAGKAPGALARRCGELGVPCIAIGGSVDEAAAAKLPGLTAAFAMSGGDMAEAAERLTAATEQVFRCFLAGMERV